MKFSWVITLAAFAGFATGCTEFTSVDISGRGIRVLNPADSFYSSSHQLVFMWEDDPDVESWQLTIGRPDLTQPLWVWDSTFRGNLQNLSFPAYDASYAWQLKGVNENSESEPLSRHFFIDVTAPAKATSFIPDGDTLRYGDSLSWFAFDSFLGMNQDVSPTVYISQVNDSAAYPVVMPLPLSTSSLRIDSLNLTNGTYFWKIESEDGAGNTRMSDVFRFQFKP